MRWRGASARIVDGRNDRYKLFWIGNQEGIGGVRILLAEKWVEKAFEVKRVSDRIMLLKLLVGDHIVTVVSVYAPQSGLARNVKDAFYDDQISVLSKIKENEILLPCGDWNGHIGHGLRNTEGERILELAITLDLVVTNSRFKKRPSHLITFESGENRRQIDYILCRKQNFKLIIDVKVIPGEECVTQHKLLVCDLRLMTCKPRPKPFFSKRRIWKLKEPTIMRK